MTNSKLVLTETENSIYNYILKTLMNTAKYILLIGYSIISLYPLVWLILYSFKNNTEIFSTNPFGLPQIWRFDNYIKAMTQFDLLLYFKNSIIVTVISVFFGILFATTFSYAIARMDFRINKKLRIYLILGQFLPVQVYVIPLIIQIKNLQLMGSLASVIIPYIAMAFPFCVLVLYGTFRALPRELEDSACIDGASIYQTFLHIILPLIKPTIAALIIYKSMQAWNEYTLAVLVLQNPKLKTLPLGLSSFVGEFSTEWGPMGATLVIASLPILILYLAFSGKIEKAMSINSGIKG